MTKSSKFLVWTLSAMAALLATSAVFAEQELYFDAAYGRAQVDDDTLAAAIEDDTDAWRVGAGFDFGNNIALEVGYLSLGDLENDSDAGFVDGETDGYTFSGRFQVPLSQRLSASARVGAFVWDSKLDTPVGTFRNKGEDLYYGVSLDLDVTRNLSLSGEWDRFEFDDGEADVFFAGLRYRF